MRGWGRGRKPTVHLLALTGEEIVALMLYAAEMTSRDPLSLDAPPPLASAVRTSKALAEAGVAHDDVIEVRVR